MGVETEAVITLNKSDQTLVVKSVASLFHLNFSFHLHFTDVEGEEKRGL